MNRALGDTLAFFTRWRLLSLKFWYAVIAMWLTSYTVLHPDKFDDVKFTAVVVNAFVGLAGHLWAQQREVTHGDG